MDLVLRCYFKNFGGRSLSFAFSLSDITRYYLLYRELMAHWIAVTGLSTCHVRYESLVTKTEGEAGKLIRFLGLKWDPAVLKFYEPGVAQSAAQTPIRCPMHKREVGAWRNYADGLADILCHLPVDQYERGSF